MSAFYTNIARSVGERWRLMIGSPSQFTLEARIFHSICLGLVVLVFAYIPYNLYAKLYIAAISCLVFGTIFLYEYYRTRFLLRTLRSSIFGFVGLVLLSVNYFANAGLEGSTDIIWPAFLLLLLTICERKHISAWAIVYVVVFVLVHWVEYQYPQLVQYPFQKGNGQFTDRITAFPLPVISIAIVIGLFRRNYDKERSVVAQRDAEKSRLLSILSHDLRAPFIQVQQYFELLNNHTLSEKDRAHVEQALKHTNDQTLYLVTNLLYWSRSQLDGFNINITSQQLTSSLKNTIDIANALSKEKGISLHTNISTEINVLADADMLQLVVRNLLQNAIKFTSAGGSIHLEATTNLDTCCIQVKDTGIGISETYLQNLFLGVAPSFGTANEKGVGLGLQLCKEFMELQNGSIQVESVLGKGTIFTISIPMA